MHTRRTCACHAAACKEAFHKGELRVRLDYSGSHKHNGRTHPKWYHPGCVEGGLGPFDTIEGRTDLPAEAQNLLQEYATARGIKNFMRALDRAMRPIDRGAGPEKIAKSGLPSGFCNFFLNILIAHQ